jgi:hypothetical protein
MVNSQRKALWIFLILTIVIGGLWQFFPLPTAQGRLNKLPLNGSTFTGQDVPLAHWEEQFFANVNMVKRIYKVNGSNYFVSILDGSNNRHVVHDPYYCFRGAGWTIDSEKSYSLPTGDAKIVDISKGNEKRTAIFWFSDKETSYTSSLRYWLQTTLRRLTFGASGPEPILIMIQPLDAGTVDWHLVLKDLGPVVSV